MVLSHVLVLASILTKITLSAYLYQECSDTIGTDFVLMFLSNLNEGTPLQVSLTTPLYNKEVQVRISTPVWNSAESVDRTITVNYGNRTVVNLPESLRVDISGKDYKTVLISADDLINVYGSNIQKNTGDACLVYPVETLGLQYVSINDNALFNDKPSVTGCIAIHHNTEINITPPTGMKVVNFTLNGLITIKLDQYELFQIQATDLTGTVIEGNKNIACFSGNSMAYTYKTTSGDHISDQLKPVSRWSSYFVIVSNPMYQHNMFKESVRIVVFYTNTHVSITYHVTAATEYVALNPTTFYEFTIDNGDAVTISSDKVISIGQITSNRGIDHTHGDQRLLMSLGVNEYLYEYTFVFPGHVTEELFTNGIFLLSKQSTRGTIQLDGTYVNNTWTDIPNSEFSYISMIIESGFHILKNARGNFGGYLFGIADAVEYGTAIGRSMRLRQTILDNSETSSGNIIENTFKLVARDVIPTIDPIKTSYTRSLQECLKMCPKYHECEVLAFRKNVTNECIYYSYQAKCATLETHIGYKLYVIRIPALS